MPSTDNDTSESSSGDGPSLERKFREELNDIVRRAITEGCCFSELNQELDQVEDSFLQRVEGSRKAEGVRRNILTNRLLIARLLDQPVSVCEGFLEELLEVGFADVHSKALAVGGFVRFCIENDVERVADPYVTQMLEELRNVSSQQLDSEIEWDELIEMFEGLREEIDV